MAQESLSTDRRVEVIDNKAADTVALLRFTLDGAEVTPASATLDAYRRDGTQVVTSGACTISGNIVSYAFDTTGAAWLIEEHYRGELSVVYSSATYLRTFAFDVVRRRIDWGISVDHVPPKWRGGVNNSYTYEIQEAINWIESKIRIFQKSNGEFLRPGEILNIEPFREAAKAKLRALACEGAITANHEFWAAERDKHERDAENLLSAALARLQLDTDDDGVLDSENESVEPLIFSPTKTAAMGSKPWLPR